MRKRSHEESLINAKFILKFRRREQLHKKEVTARKQDDSQKCFSKEV